MVGVIVSTEARSGQTQPLRSTSGQFFAVGITAQGSTDAAIRLRSMADVYSLLGDRVSYGALHDQLEVFFAEGGQQAYVARVVGPASSKGLVTVNDRAGTPLPTLKFEAADPGSWSSGVEVVISNGVNPNTFSVAVFYNDKKVHDERNIESPAEAVSRFSRSRYVVVTNVGSATAAPNNNPATGTFTLSAGADDRVSITDTHWVNALSKFGPDLGDGAVSLPGKNSTAIVAGLQAHCEANRRIGIIAGNVDDDITDLLDRAAAIDSDALGLFGPWIVVDNGSGGTRQISPEGYVAAVRTRAHDQAGPWRAPAGSVAKSSYVQDVVTVFSREDIDALDAGKVNAIRQLNATVRLYNWRSLSEDVENWSYLTNRDLVNYLVVEAERRLEDYVFSPIDGKGQVLASVAGSLTGLVEPIRLRGGLFERVADDGAVIDPGYRVIVDSSNNTPETLAANEINATLLVRVAPVGGLIRLRITKAGILSGL